MYIIDPFYIYIIEQLDPLNQILVFSLFISICVLACSFILCNLCRNHNKESFNTSNINQSYHYLTNHLDAIKNNLNVLTLGLFPEKDKLISELKNKSNTFVDLKIESTAIVDEEFKTNLDDLLYKSNHMVDCVNSDLTNIKYQINQFEKEYDDYSLVKKIQKISLIVLCICLVLIIFIPTKQSAYKILLTNYLTVENINKSGDALIDGIDKYLDKITDSIIKIEESRSK